MSRRKILRVVAGVEDDQAHPVEHAPLDPVDDRIGDLAVGAVAPPGQHVGRREDRVGQAVIGLVERRGPDVEAGLAEARRDRRVDPVRVDAATGGSERSWRHSFQTVTRVIERHATADALRGAAGTVARPRHRAPPIARIASQSRAMRRPTSGGLGFSIWPDRTLRNCSQTGSGATDRTLRRRRRPARWISSRSPQMPVRRIASVGEDADVGVAGRDRAAAGVHRHERTGREPAHHRRPDVDGPAIVLQPRGDLGEILAGEVRDRVEHVGAGVEQEAAAGEVGLLRAMSHR